MRRVDRPRGPVRVRIEPATSSRWKDIERLFGERGACGGCWCMFWRLPRADYDRGRGVDNRASLRRLTRNDPPPGVLAYVGGEVAGWCAVAPRQDFVRLSGSRILKPVDEQSVWSVPCFFVAKEFRGCGVSTALLKGAVRLARRYGARIVEGYPVDTKGKRQVDVFVYTGLEPAFKRAGFIEVARRSPGRPIMRWVARR